MSSKNCLCYVTTPGQPEGEEFMIWNEGAEWLRKTLKDRGVEVEFVDTIPGWANNNQSFMQFRAAMDLSWGWCLPSAFSAAEKETFEGLLNRGLLVMLLEYEEADGSLTPHH